MIKHKESHMDHGFTQAQWDHIFKLFAGREGFFNEIIGLPGNLGTVMDDLYGPSCGDQPIPEVEVFYTARGARAWNSRMTRMPKRPTCFVRVIAGPHDGHPCVLYTAYGVHAHDTAPAPREPGDIRKEMDVLEEERRTYFRAFQNGTATDEMKKQEKVAHDKIIALRPKRDEADVFWGQHALASL